MAAFALGKYVSAIAFLLFGSLFAVIGYRRGWWDTDQEDQHTQRDLATIAFLYALFIAIVIFKAHVLSFVFDGFPYDGPFQSFNPLRRLHQGELPYIDFHYFHGTFLPVLMWPIFEFLGANLYASEMSRQILDLGVFCAGVWVCGRLLFSVREERHLFFVGYLLIIISNTVLTDLQNPLFSIHAQITRAAPQFLAMVAGYVVFSEVFSGASMFRQALLAFAFGGITALAVLVTNEQGIYLFASLLVVVGIRVLRAARATEAFVIFAAIIGSFGLCLAAAEWMADGQGPLYQLKQVARDQVWYFGTFPNIFLTGLDDLAEAEGIYKLPRAIARLMFAIIILWLPIALSGSIRLTARGGALIGAISYGIFALGSLTGYFGLHYFDPLLRALILATAVCILTYRSLDAGSTISVVRPFSAVLRFWVSHSRPLLLSVSGLSVVAVMWTAKPWALAELLRDAQRLPVDPVLGVKLPDDRAPLNSRWSERLDAVVGRAILRGKGVVLPQRSFSAPTAAGVEGPFRNGLLHVACLTANQLPAVAIAPGNVLRVFSGEYRHDFSILLYDYITKQICVELADGGATNILIRAREQNRILTAHLVSDSALRRREALVVTTDFNETGSHKFNGIYGDRAAVILKVEGKRQLVTRGYLPQPGESLRFPYSGERQVKAVYSTGYVELDSGNLDPYLDGYPQPIAINGKSPKYTSRDPAASFFEATVRSVNTLLLMSPGDARRIGVGETIKARFANRWAKVKNKSSLGIVALDGYYPATTNAWLYPLNYWVEWVGASNDWRYDKKEGAGMSLDVPAVWSLYSGIPDAIVGSLNPSGVDYVIHALGTARGKYPEEFRAVRPEWFVTLRSMPSPIYNRWLLNMNWSLILDALASYDVSAATQYAVYWKRRDEPRSVSFGLERELDSGIVTREIAGCRARGDTRYLNVTVDYTTENRLRNIPVLGRLPRYLVTMEGAVFGVPVSVPPYETSFSFPVPFNCEQGQGHFVGKVMGLGKGFASFNIRKVSVRPITSHYAQLNVLFMRDERSRRPRVASWGKALSDVLLPKSS